MEFGWNLAAYAREFGTGIYATNGSERGWILRRRGRCLAGVISVLGGCGNGFLRGNLNFQK